MILTIQNRTFALPDLTPNYPVMFQDEIQVKSFHMISNNYLVQRFFLAVFNQFMQQNNIVAVASKAYPADKSPLKQLSFLIETTETLDLKVLCESITKAIVESQIVEAKEVEDVDTLQDEGYNTFTPISDGEWEPMEDVWDENSV